MIRGFLLSFITILLSTSLFGGDPIRLWSPDGSFVDEYDLLVAKLKKGDVLELEPGHTVTIEGPLGKGTTTFIYSIDGGKAIRLPLNSGLSEGNLPYHVFITLYLEGYQKLVGSEIPLVEVFVGSSSPDRYVIVRREKIEFTLEELIARNDPHDIAWKELEAFAKKTWNIRMIGDMHVGQLAYTESGWKLMDYTAAVKMARASIDTSVFTYMRKLPFAVRARLENAVNESRTEHSMRSPSRLMCAIYLSHKLFVTATRRF